MVLLNSSGVLSSVLARPNSAINSVASAPIIWAPRSSPYFLSKISLTRPSLSPIARLSVLSRYCLSYSWCRYCSARMVDRWPLPFYGRSSHWGQSPSLRPPGGRGPRGQVLVGRPWPEPVRLLVVGWCAGRRRSLPGMRMWRM